MEREVLTAKITETAGDGIGTTDCADFTDCEKKLLITEANEGNKGHGLGVPKITQVARCGGEFAMEAAVAEGVQPIAHCDHHAALEKNILAHDVGGSDLEV